MIRNLLAAAFALLAVSCAQPEPEDLTAHFSKTGGQPVTVEAAANGDARVVAGDETYLRLGGMDYIVMRDSRGPFVARAEDLFALLTEDPATPRPQPDYVTAVAGDETIAGIKGKIWKIHPKDVPSLPTVDAVVSSDPALAPMGKAIAAHLRALIIRNSTMMGAPGNLEKAMIALGEKGAVLRFGTVLRLERIDRAPIAKDKLKLPSAPLDRAALKARLAAPERAAA